MKKNIKSSSNNYVTKQDLRSELKLTKQELRSEMQSTTQSLKSEIKSIAQSLRSEMQSTTQNLRSEMQSTTQNLRSEMKQGFVKQNKEFGKIISDILVDIDLKFKQVQKDWISQFDQLKKVILDSNLKIIEELRSSRDEQVILAYRQKVHFDKLDDHAQRISQLEQSLVLKLSN